MKVILLIKRLVVYHMNILNIFKVFGIVESHKTFKRNYI